MKKLIVLSLASLSLTACNQGPRENPLLDFQHAQNVVQNIQKETGISFSIDPEMATIPFSATVQAENWEATVKELIKGFSRIEVWTDNLNTSRVWLYQGR